MDTQLFHSAKKTRLFIIAIALCFIVPLFLIASYVWAPIYTGDSSTFVYIDSDDNIDSVYDKVSEIASPRSLRAFCTIARHMHYADHIKSGRYEVKSGVKALELVRTLRNGQQTPLKLVIPEVRTTGDMARELGKKLMADSLAWISALSDPAICDSLYTDTVNIIALFIPNTYEVYWNTSVTRFLERMKTEHDRFWNEERLHKAHTLDLTPFEVGTLASIVDEETANKAEKPMVARMYYNRLNYGKLYGGGSMLLQADPTVKFALKQFGLRRIYNQMLTVDSPYNTYKYKGLPPGPIKVPSTDGIDAVLNMPEHDYLYMCAKEDFSGTHNFAHTYAEHQQNARKYINALNERGIK